MAELNRRDFIDLGPTRFAQLVGTLVRLEHPNSEVPDAPDGGADVLLEGRAKGPTYVWQVKHFEGTQPPWRKCVESLDRAVARYSPDRVTFVFSRDLTAPMKKTFKDKLQDRRPDIEIDYWGLFQLRERIANAAPSVRQRYFGDDSKDVLPGLLRALEHGGKPLETAADLAQRAFSLSEFANSRDPTFIYDINVGNVEAPDVTWNQVPYLVMTTEVGEHRLRVPVWPRAEANVEPVTVRFDEDEVGRTALADARRALAAGQPAELTQGVALRLPEAPALVKQSLAEVELTKGILQPGDSQPLKLSVGGLGSRLGCTFDLRPVPPDRAGVHSFGAVTDCLVLWLDLEPREFPHVQLHLRLEFRAVDDYGRTAAAARLAERFFRGDAVALDAPGFLPSEAAEPRGLTGDSEQADRLHAMGQLYVGLALLERYLGVRLDVPDDVRYGDIQELLVAARLLQERKGEANFGTIEQELPDDEVPAFLSQIDGGGIGRHALTMTVLGHELTLGLGEFDLPPFSLAIPEKSATPGRTVIRLIPRRDHKVKVRLLEVGGNPDSWRSTIMFGTAAATSALRGLGSGLLVDVDGRPLR